MTRHYSNVDIFTEEAYRREEHGMAMVVKFRRGQPCIRIIPSIKWPNPPDVEFIMGLLNHESVHICLWKNLGTYFMEALDKLPQPCSFEQYFSGVWGLKEVKALRSE